MKMNHLRNVAGRALLALSALASACQAPDSREAVFRMAERPFDGAATRSRLTDTDIETKKTGITLAAYRSGALAACSHFTDGLDAMALPLEPGRTYAVYALVNMGDRTDDFPDGETDLPAMTWTIPSYTDGPESLSARGLPMAGKLAYDGRTGVIPVERLLARVTARITCEWTGAAIRSVRVCNLNRTLRPFGESAAGQAWEEQEFQAGTGSPSGTFTFYVPENRQGTLPGTGSSLDRSPDRNEEVRQRSGQLTYLETVAEGTGLYTGSITYRSYLGRDAASDYDIRRNASYDWTLRFTADGLQYQDWKHDNDLTDTRFLYWEGHPGEQAVHITLKAGTAGTRAGNAWLPGNFVLGDSTGEGRIQGSVIDAGALLQHIGYTVDTSLFRYDSHSRNAIRFTVGDRDLREGDYEIRVFFLDRPQRYISAWLHVRNDNDLHIDDGWTDGGESELH